MNYDKINIELYLDLINQRIDAVSKQIDTSCTIDSALFDLLEHKIMTLDKMIEHMEEVASK